MDEIKAKFEDKVAMIPESGCWLWNAGVNSKGYGYFTVSGRSVLAHRASFVIYNGPVPKHLMVCHKCDTPLCVNPSHLFLGDALANVRDAMEKGRLPQSMSRPRMTSTEVAAMRIDGLSMTHRQVAQKHGVSKGTVYRVLNRVKPYHFEVN